MTANRQTIFLHGWGFASGIVDLLGTEHNYKAPCLYTLAGSSGFNAAVDAVSDMCSEESLLVGWSMGGQVAIEVAARTNNVRGLLLISSAPVMVNKHDWPHSIELDAYNKLHDIFKQDPSAALKKICSLTAYGEGNYRQALNTLSLSIAEEHHFASLASLLEDLGHIDYRESFNHLSIPVLFCGGDNDALLNTNYLSEIYDNGNATILPSCGHAPLLCHADVINSMVNKLHAELQ